MMCLESQTGPVRFILSFLICDTANGANTVLFAYRSARTPCSDSATQHPIVK